MKPYLKDDRLDLWSKSASIMGYQHITFLYIYDRNKGNLQGSITGIYPQFHVLKANKNYPYQEHIVYFLSHSAN